MRGQNGNADHWVRGDAGEGDEDGGVLIRVIEPQTAMSLANSAVGIITQMAQQSPICRFSWLKWPGFAAVWRVFVTIKAVFQPLRVQSLRCSSNRPES
jgi:hypothetical protein